MSEGEPAPDQPGGFPDSACAGWRPEWGAGPGPGHGCGGSPVPRQLTRVTGRRITQFIIDSFLAGLVPGTVLGLAHACSHRMVSGLTWLIAAAVWVVIMFWYWVARPAGNQGQTLGMRLLGIQVISKSDGCPASARQLVIRWAGLLLDSCLLTPVLGYVVIISSRHRQRIGDHIAGTLVVRHDGGHGGAAASRRTGSTGVSCGPPSARWSAGSSR